MNVKILLSDYKQILNEVFVISRIIKVKIGVISRRLRLITLTETLIILDITHSFYYALEEVKKSSFYFFTDGKVDMITLRNHALRSYRKRLLKIIKECSLYKIT